MAQIVGQAIITHVTGTDNYSYTWKDDVNQPDVDTVVTGKTKTAAWTEVGALLNALSGQLKRVEITGVSE